MRGRATAHSEDLVAQAAAIAAAVRRLHARGLVAGAEGNVSVRQRDGTFLMTGAGRDKAVLQADDVVLCDAHGHLVGHPAGGDAVPSTEVRMHSAAYVARPDIMAVVHAHPPAATGFAAAGRPIPANVLPELPVVVGPVALVPYGRPGTDALPDALRPFLPAHQAFLLANHGVTTLGASLDDAVLRMESVEQAARILLVAHLLGGAQPLPPDEANALAALWSKRHGA